VVKEVTINSEPERVRSPIQSIAKPGSKMRQNLDNLLKMQEVQKSILCASTLDKKPMHVPKREQTSFHLFETSAKSQPKYLKSNNNPFSKTFVAGLKTSKWRPKSSFPLSLSKRAKASDKVFSAKNTEPEFKTFGSETAKLQSQFGFSY
jgi:hypothetical protein